MCVLENLVVSGLFVLQCVCVHFNRMHCSAGVWTEHKQDRFSHGDLPFGIYYTLCGNGVIS